MDKRRHDVLEDQPIRDATPMAAQRMRGGDLRSLGKQRGELVPQGFQQA